ncbi:hypothetical protein DFH08DRAFT_841626 [Mycena albidolilacea]|uniref:Uncharacterized protein n=1 Tax=Mycena albidolilacea TaxID=1033008 RepID=A0AAD7AMR6_9AGAR|nr:hypothetical protein DFH08DRAFT_841626 [Mycena albidolilacea]
MARQSKLTTIPPDIYHQLLSIFPNFRELKIVILTYRCFHDAFKARRKILLRDVAQNLLGHSFDEAMLLAREQEAAYGRGAPPTEDFSTKIVSLIVTNHYVLRSLERVVVRLLKRDKDIDIYEAGMWVRLPSGDTSPAESSRYMTAGYRFWRFSLQRQKEHAVFLKNLTRSQLLELNHFVTGLRDLVDAMGGHPPESDHDKDFISGVLSSGPQSILNIWEAFVSGDEYFDEAFGIAGDCDGEGFFSYAYMDAIDRKGLHRICALDALEPIFDGDNEKMHKLLKKAAKERKKAAAKKKEHSVHS